ncbi:MAG: antifreeze protein [Pseudomonadota bacterium]
MSPLALLDLQLKFTHLLVDSQSVIALRILALSGVIPARPDESLRMVLEKLPALSKSYSEATQAAMRGQPPHAVMSAALSPLNQKVHANRKRLTKG